MDKKVVEYVNEHGETKILRNITQIGEGSYGVVYKALLDGFGEVAVKYQLRLDQDDIKAALLEYEKAPLLQKHSIVLRKIVVPPQTLEKFVRLKDSPAVSVTHSDIKQYRILYIYDLAVGMDLYDIVRITRESDAPFSPDTLKHYISQLLEGLDEIQKAGLVHRDIKTENVMLHNGKLKYIDYGMLCEPTGENKCKGLRGTLYFMSPTIVKAISEGIDPTPKDWYAGDLYALGITIMVLIGEVPFQNDQEDAEWLFRENSLDESYEMVNEEIESILTKKKRANFYPIIHGLTSQHPMNAGVLLLLLNHIN